MELYRKSMNEMIISTKSKFSQGALCEVLLKYLWDLMVPSFEKNLEIM